MYTTQLWQLYAWLITKSGRIYAPDIVLKEKGISTELYAFSRDLRLVSGGSTLSATENGWVIYQVNTKNGKTT